MDGQAQTQRIEEDEKWSQGCQEKERNVKALCEECLRRKKSKEGNEVIETKRSMKRGKQRKQKRKIENIEKRDER